MKKLLCCTLCFLMLWYVVPVGMPSVSAQEIEPKESVVPDESIGDIVFSWDCSSLSGATWGSWGYGATAEDGYITLRPADNSMDTGYAAYYMWTGNFKEEGAVENVYAVEYGKTYVLNFKAIGEAGKEIQYDFKDGSIGMNGAYTFETTGEWEDVWSEPMTVTVDPELDLAPGDASIINGYPLRLYLYSNSNSFSSSYAYIDDIVIYEVDEETVVPEPEEPENSEELIESIEVEDVTVVDNYDGMRYGHYDENDEWIEDSWFKYNYDPETITITCKDGTVFSGDYYDIYWDVVDFFGKGSFDLTSDQSYENQWSVGNTYKATLSFLGYECTYNVTVTESPIESIEIEDITVIENNDGYWNGHCDENDEWIENSWFEYDYQPETLTITCKDGTIFSGDYWNVYWEVEELFGDSFSRTSDQSYENQWSVGNTYKATLSFLGYECTYNVTVTESPIESIEIEDVSIIEFYDGYYSDGYFYYSLYNLNGTVTLKDGTKEHIDGSFEMDNVWYSIETNAWDMQNEQPWTAGNTYEVTGTLLGVSDTFNVTTIENPVKRIEIDDLVLIENCNGYVVPVYDEYGNETDETWFEYLYEPDSVTIVYKDGTTVSGPAYNIYEQTGYFLNFNSDQAPDNQWIAGNTYQVTAEYLGIQATYNVTIEETPIESIIFLEFPDDTDCMVGEVADLKGAKLKVNYKDDRYDIINITDHAGWMSPFYVTLDKLGVSKEIEAITTTYTVAGKQNVEFNLMGQTFSFPVTVKENTVKKVNLTTNENKELVIVLTHTDGTVEDVIVEGLRFVKGGDEPDGTILSGAFVYSNNYIFPCSFYETPEKELYIQTVFSAEGRPISNRITEYDYFHICNNVLKRSTSVSIGCNKIDSFDGTITADNVNKILDIALRITGTRWTTEVNSAGMDTMVIPIEDAEAAIEGAFAVSNIDLTQYAGYDSQSQTFRYPVVGRGGDASDVISLKYVDGIWYGQTEYINEPIYFKLNDDMKIISFSKKLTVTDVKVTTLPNKTSYHVGDKLNITGMVVTADYDYMPSVVVTDYIVTGYTSTVGSKTVKVTLGNKSDTFNVTVSDHSYKTTTTKATTSANGKIVTKCSVCGDVKSTKTIAKVSNIKLSFTKKNYTGSAISAPTLTVKDSNGKALVKGTDYTVTGLVKRTNVGRYKVTVTFKGNYSGTKTLYYTITPKAPSSVKVRLRTVTGGYDDVVCSWTKATGASGYAVYYKKASASSYTLLGRTTGTSMTKKDLADGVKYTFKVVPYYTSNGTRYTSLASRTASIYALKKIATPTVTASSGKVKVK